MLEKFGDAAERMATGCSRRAFLGRLGRGAMGVSVTIGGALASASWARAARPCPPGTHPSRCRDGSTLCCPRGTACIGAHVPRCG
ncbi:MAG: hypothetical protein U0790_26140 [Isosphaeraceae bacterium]